MELPGNQATLVLERRGQNSAGGGQDPHMRGAEGNDSGDEEGRETAKSVFDPSIFE